MIGASPAMSAAPEPGDPATGVTPADPAAVPAARRRRSRPAGAAEDSLRPVPSPVQLDSVERAVADIATGRPVVVVDDADRENEGDPHLRGEPATGGLAAFMVRHMFGYICAAPPGAELRRPRPCRRWRGRTRMDWYGRAR